MPRIAQFLACLIIAFQCSDPVEKVVAQESGLPATSEKSVVKKTKTRALFIGNSYTARHNLANVVEALAEAGKPNLDFQPTTVIYGGRTLKDHWRLGTQNFVNSSLSKDQQQATISALEKTLIENPEDGFAKRALTRHHELLKELDSGREKWDVVVLQSYRDDLEGHESLYAQFAPRFAKLAKAQGAKVILYVTTPTTQNAKPLTGAPDPAPVMKKSHETAALADQIGANAAPMALAGLRCQTKRPDLTTRFVNDAHLNQNMAYLSACSIYAAIYEKSPVGLPVDSVTDIRFLKNDRKSKRDRDGKPITRTFGDKDRADLQKIAWEGYKEFQDLRSKAWEKYGGKAGPTGWRCNVIWFENPTR